MISTVDTRYKEFDRELFDWGQKHRSTQLRLNDINKDIRGFITDQIRSYSILARLLFTVPNLLCSMATEKVNITAIVFKASYAGSSCTYGYLFARPEFAFVSCCPTYRSQDGEYRHRLIPWKQFEELRARFAERIEIIEAAVLSKIESKELILNAELYGPANVALETAIDESRAAVKILTICVLIDYFQIQNNIMENHVNPAYKHIITELWDKEQFDQLVKVFGISDYNNLRRFFSCLIPRNRSGIGTILPGECGQKIIPLTSIEAVRIGDINFNVWREMYFTSLCANLTLNFISPSFPFVIGWFFIQNAHPGLFENLAMHEKYEHSKVAAEISDQLKTADKLNYVERNRLKGAISNRFLRLSKYIHDSIYYADSALKLTDLCVCSLAEYVGRTLRDAPMMAAVGNKTFTLMFADHTVFVKFLFEFIYGLYCMNTRVGLMHGDLHMNNATIHQMVFMIDAATGKPAVENPHVVYIISNDEVYLFKHYSTCGMIIDHSRSIIGDPAILERDFGARFAAEYFQEQRYRVMHVLYRYFPKLVDKYKKRLEDIIANNFPLLFKIMTVIDAYVISSNMAGLITIDEHIKSGKVKVDPAIGRILTQVSRKAETVFLNLIQDALDGKLTDASKITWPNLTVMRECFGEYRLTRSSKPGDIKIVDMFRADAEMRWEIEDPSTWGPIISPDKGIELRKKYNLPPDTSYEEWLEIRSADESSALDNLIRQQEEQESDLLDFEPWMLI